MVNVSKHLQKNFCSQVLSLCINVKWKVQKSVKNGLINAMAMARWQKRQWWCFVAYRNQGRIYYSEYILFLFFWQRIRIFICDIPHPAAAAGSGGGGVWCLNLIMWLLLVHIIIILILHQHHLLPLLTRPSIDSYTRSASSAPLACDWNVMCNKNGGLSIMVIGNLFP